MSARKRYRPRGVNPQSVIVAMQGMQLLSQKDQMLRTQPVRDAVELVAKGEATKEHWSVIFDALNMLEQFGQMPRVMRGAKPYVETMQQVIVSILDRAKAGTRALYASELDDLRGFADLWAEVLSTVTHRDFYECETKTHKRLVQVLRSGQGVKVLEVA